MHAKQFVIPVFVHFPLLIIQFLFPILSNAKFSSAASSSPSTSSILDNGVVGDPVVECMDDRVKIIFRTQRPFVGRIFVKGMVENENCVRNYEQNSRPQVDFELTNGQCNMRRSRKLGPEQRGVEQSITIIISFHQIFITKIDRSFRCTCFFMEADKVVTNRFDVSDQATTELIDTARIFGPLCSYTVRRGSITGPIVTYASVGEQVFHVWQCESDLFSMLVHNCFVDDGAGKDRKPLIDEQGCSTDTVILSELTYNSQANLAYSEVNVFKFADKVTTYFQCAVSTCMISEGMCSGKTPPHCGPNSRIRRTINGQSTQTNLGEGNTAAVANNVVVPFSSDDPYTMDLSAEKIVVLDLDDSAETDTTEAKIAAGKNWREGNYQSQATLAATSRLGSVPSTFASTLHPSICFGEVQFGIILAGVGLLAFGAFFATGILIWRQRKSKKSWNWNR